MYKSSQWNFCQLFLREDGNEEWEKSFKNYEKALQLTESVQQVLMNNLKRRRKLSY